MYKNINNENRIENVPNINAQKTLYLLDNFVWRYKYQSRKIESTYIFV